MKKPYSFIYLDIYLYLFHLISFPNAYKTGPATWGEADGRRCLVVPYISGESQDGTPASMQRFWVDVERGGHVIRFEIEEQGKLYVRFDQVSLTLQTTEDGGEVWFPVSGKYAYYGNSRKITDYVTEEFDFRVISGTLHINGGLPDSRFSLDYGLSPAARTLARQYNSGARIPESNRPVPADVSLKKVIPDADDPTKRLVAVPESERSCFSRWGVSAAAVAVGGAALGLGAYLRRKSG